MRTLVWCFGLVAALGLIMAPSAWAQDRSEAEHCAACHFYPGTVVMPFVVDKWLESAHANSYNADHNDNTYCAKCHAPFQADPAATHGDNETVPLEEWEAVTCAACHPPHDLRVEWGTPIGTYDIANNTDPLPYEGYTPVYLEAANELCEYCHSGTRHAKDFKSFGAVMFEKKLVNCVDCHMAEVPNTLDPPDRMTRTHDFQVAANLPYSCGTIEGGCHSNHTEEWAAKQILKSKIHGKK